MNFNQLEVFCLVAQVKSFSKAAKLAHLTQPAISAQIQSLEASLNVTLFNRTSTGVQLTEAGQVVHHYVKKMLRLQEEMEKQVTALSGEENMELIVGGSSTVGNYALPCSIWTFKEKYPQLQIRLEVGNTREILQKLQDGTLDVAVVEGVINPVGNDWVVKDISIEDLVLVAPPQSPWSQKDTLTLEELKEIPLIQRELGSGIRKTFEEALRGAGLDPSTLNVVAEMGSIDAIKSAVEAGLGLTIACRMAVQKEIRHGSLKALTIKDLPLSITFKVIYRPGEFPNPMAQRFVRFIAAPDQRAFC